MLDSVVGPGHAVVTTTAELDFDQAETNTETYASDPSVAALSESISREAYNGNGNGTGRRARPGQHPGAERHDQHRRHRPVREQQHHAQQRDQQDHRGPQAAHPAASSG